jgi:hypothetical protein
MTAKNPAPTARRQRWGILAAAALGCLILFGALGCGRANGKSGDAPAPAPAFDAARAWKLLEAQVAIGPRPAGSNGAESTRKLIENALQTCGLSPEREGFQADTPAGKIDFCNVFADLSSDLEPSDQAPIVILVSHYDTKRMEGFVGANDAGSSTAVLLELARVLTQRIDRPVTYRFLFVDGEEAVREFWQDPDNRYGSRHHAQVIAGSALKSRVRAAVVIDMVGDRDLGLIKDTNSSPNLLACFFDAARELGLGQHVAVVTEPVLDDHLSFKEIGIPAVTLIDLRFGPDGTNAWWHTREDTLDKCSAESLDKIGRIVLAGLPRVERLIAASKGR